MLSVLLLLLPYICSTAWDPKWPSEKFLRFVCDGQTFAIEAKFSTLNETNGMVKYSCQLKFDMDIDGEEYEMCQYMLPAYLSQAKKENGLVVCKYEFLYICPPGQFPIHDQCIEFEGKKVTLETANRTCNQKGGHLPNRKLNGEGFFSNFFHVYYPPKLGFHIRDFWLENGDIYVAKRTPLNYQVGQTYTPTDGFTAAFFCIYNAAKTQHDYEKSCNVINNGFNLAAKYHEGTCYIASTSVYTMTNNDSEKLHESCQWFSKEDRVVSPLSSTRSEAIDAVRAAKPRFNSAYFMTTAKKKGADEKAWEVINVGGRLTEIRPTLWSKGRPKENDGSDGRNLRALAMPRKNKELDALLHDTVEFHRAHLICATGVSIRDMGFKECNNGWEPVVRDNGRILCMKAFNKEMAGLTGIEAKEFCKKNYNAYLAPMADADEEAVVIGFINKLFNNNPPYKSIWIGATRDEDAWKQGRRHAFNWDIDGKAVNIKGVTEASKWDKNQPDNSHDYSPAGEGCLQLYLQNKKWNDFYCERVRLPSTLWEIAGGVCAKYLE